MDIIKNDDELDPAVLRMRNLRGAKTNTPESNQMKILAVLAEAYEEKRHPIEPPTQIEAIRFRIEQMNKTFSYDKE